MKPRDPLYEHYTTFHVGEKPTVDTVVERDILDRLPRVAVDVLDLGCGQGQLVALCHARGLKAYGVDHSEEQIAVGVKRGIANLTCGDAALFLSQNQARFDAIVAVDFLEHVESNEVVELLGLINCALRDGGCFVARVPNGVSPFHGFYSFGDFTHQTIFSARSFRQIALSTGFSTVSAWPCRPRVHGLISAFRALAWAPVEALLQFCVRVETGQSAGIVTQNLVVRAEKTQGRPGGAIDLHGQL